MAIIGFKGRIGQGKDLCAQIALYHFMNPGFTDSEIEKLISTSEKVSKVEFTNKDGSITTWLHKKYSDPLKDILSVLLSVDRAELENRDFKESTCPGCKSFSYYKPVVIKNKEGVLGAIEKQFNDMSKQLLEDPSFVKTTVYSAAWESLEKTQLYNSMKDFGLFETDRYDIRLLLHIPTVREIMQILGTEGVRKALGQDVWTELMFQDYDPAGNVNYVISDVRFKNEAFKILSMGPENIVYKVVDPRKDHIFDAHDSEQEANDDSYVTKTIVNDGSIQDLIYNLRQELYSRFPVKW